MLIHKNTLGVLTQVWNNDGTRLVRATLKTVPYIDPDEWWEVNEHSAIGKTALMFYPFLIAEVKDGNLVGLLKPEKTSTKEINELIRETQKEEASKRGYKTLYKNIPSSGLLDFIAGDLSAQSKKRNVNSGGH